MQDRRATLVSQPFYPVLPQQKSRAFFFVLFQIFFGKRRCFSSKMYLK